VIEHVLVGVALLTGLGGGYWISRSRLRGRDAEHPDRVHQILLPFTGTEVSRRALDAALRLARAEGATLMPAYLAQVPKRLPLGCAIPNEATRAMPMLEAIEQRATAQGIAVDARIERGRSYRHALERLLAHESFDRVVVPASASGATGFSGDDLVWLLRKAPAEVLILRPAPDDDRRVQPLGAKPIRSAPAISSIAAREERLTEV
jgi:nucleotide-binding universal stress UspA family protein